MSPFTRRLGAITSGALVARVLYIVLVAEGTHGAGDFQFYNWTADLLAEGRGFINPFTALRHGRDMGTALHPPAWPVVLSVVSALGGVSSPLGQTQAGGYIEHRLAGAVLGSLLVLVLGLLARRIGGSRVGLIAAILVAFSPAFIAMDGSTMSETLYGPLLATVLLVAYSLLEAPSWQRALLLGALIGACALTRPDGLLLVLFVGGPVAWRAGGGLAPRLGRLVVIALGVALFVLPWTARNTAVFGEPVLISTNEGALWRGANCDATYAGPDIGAWRFDCLRPSAGGNEAERSRAWRRDGLAYATDHLHRLPLVMVVRVLRTWNLYQPVRQASFMESQPRRVALVGGVAGWALALSGAYGAVLLYRRRQTLIVLLGPIVMVTAVAAIGQGGPRFRYAADVALVVLAAVALEDLLRASGACRWLSCQPPPPSGSCSISASLSSSR